jgi:hypothetical protein
MDIYLLSISVHFSKPLLAISLIHRQLTAFTTVLILVGENGLQEADKTACFRKKEDTELCFGVNIREALKFYNNFGNFKEKRLLNRRLFVSFHLTFKNRASYI